MERIKTEQEKYLEAKEQVKEIKGFYAHLTSYICVITFLIVINIRYSPDYLWFLWTATGWGIGVLVHSNRAFNWFPVFGKDWEEKKINEFLNNQKNNLNG
jgi:hypothetical protein